VNRCALTLRGAVSVGGFGDLGEPLSRYEVDVEAATGRLRKVGRPRLFETSRAFP
jgi:hypothetical protein